MSTLRISNIEAKSVPASATIDEKIKITNSSGDPLVFIDGKTSGITTVGINTTDPNITFDANSNIVVTGIITATKFVGAFEVTSLEVGNNIKLGNAGVITATSFVGSGANLTNLPTQVTITGNADNRIITGGSGVNLNGEAGLTYDGSALIVRGSDTVTGSGGTKTLSLRGGDANNEFVNLSFDTGAGGPLAVISAEADATGVYPNTSGSLTFNTQVSGGVFERLRIKADGSTFLQTSNVNINRGTSGAGYPLTVRGPNDGDAIRIERGNQYQWHIGQDTNGGGSNLYFKSNTTKEIVFPSTGGIAFNGEYVANNTLNDYELGNWNSAVQWQNGNTTGGYNNTTTVQGTYLKIGNVVHVWITVYPNQYNSGGDCVIVGIPVPFAISAGGAVAFAPYSGRGNYGGWLTNSTYPRTYANLNSSGTKIVPLVTGNENGAGYWGHKSGTVNANASFTATYYTS